jgi:hypothetical protein
MDLPLLRLLRLLVLQLLINWCLAGCRRGLGMGKAAAKGLPKLFAGKTKKVR